MNRLPPLSSQSNQSQSFLPGNLLVASPKFGSHPLTSGVILVLEHSPQGAKGVVLNSLENEEVKRWCRRLATQTDKQAVMAQIRAAAESQKETHGTPFTVCMEQPGRSLEDAIEHLGASVRLLVGNVSWKGGQLDREITNGVWMFLPGFSQFLFGDFENLWETCVKCIGESVLLTAPGVQPHGDATWN